MRATIIPKNLKPKDQQTNHSRNHNPRKEFYLIFKVNIICSTWILISSIKNIQIFYNNFFLENFQPS